MKLDDVKKLQQKKYRNQFGYYLVEGEHLILELEKASKGNQSLAQNVRVYVTEDQQDFATCFEKTVISKKNMAQISDTKSPQGIIASVPLPNLKHVASTPDNSQKYIYLHEVQDPGNLGTILRTLAWFGGFTLLLSPNSVDPFNPKVVRSSMGAIFHVPMELDVELESLQNRFKRFAYLDMQGTKVSDQTFSDYPCYLFGNEARGVPHEALDAFNVTAFTIPGSGAIESLNLAMAVSMSVYQLSV